MKILEKKSFAKAFQMNPEEERRYLLSTPTTNQMRKSIELIERKADDKPHKQQEQFIDLDFNIYGSGPKRPLPRDGFSCT
jgi:hypothetical protein